MRICKNKAESSVALPFGHQGVNTPRSPWLDSPAAIPLLPRQFLRLHQPFDLIEVERPKVVRIDAHIQPQTRRIVAGKAGIVEPTVTVAVEAPRTVERLVPGGERIVVADVGPAAQPDFDPGMNAPEQRTKPLTAAEVVVVIAPDEDDVTAAESGKILRRLLFLGGDRGTPREEQVAEVEEPVVLADALVAAVDDRLVHLPCTDEGAVAMQDDAARRFGRA